MKPRSFFKAFLQLVALAFLAVGAQAQTSYNVVATGNNLSWTTASIWDQNAVPGSDQDGTTNDLVLLENQRTGGSQLHTLRLLEAAGEIGELRVGGRNDATSNVQDMRFEFRDGSLTVNGLTTIGGDASGNPNGGRIEMPVGANAESSFNTLTVNDVISGSTDGNNRILLNANGSTLNILGDMDSAAIRDDNTNTTAIDLQILNGGKFFINTGTNPQQIYTQNFDIGSSNDPDQLGVVAEAVIGSNKTVSPSDGTIDVGRNTADNESNRDVSGKLDILGGTLNATGTVRIGSLPAGTGTGNTTSGIVNVGDISNTGTLTAGTTITLGLTGAAEEIATATLNINHPDSTVTATTGLNLGAAGNVASTLSSATLTLNDGTFTVTGALTTSTSADVNVNIYGGEFVLLNPLGTTRGAVGGGDLDFTGGRMDFLMIDGMPAFDTSTINLSTAGNSLIDLTNADAGNVFSLSDSVTWDDGGGNMDWDTATNWDPDILPSVAGGGIPTGSVFTILRSVGTISGTATLGDSDGGWSLFSGNMDVTVARTGSPTPGGPAVAIIDTLVTVNRTSDLNIQAGPATSGSDATNLQVRAGTLNVTGGSDLQLGGTDGAGNILASNSAAVSVTGDLLFGGPGGTFTGTYDISGASTLAVTGEIASTVGGNLFINSTAGSPLTVGGDISLGIFAVGENDNSLATITYTLANNITAATGRLTVARGTEAGVGAKAVLTIPGSNDSTVQSLRVAEDGSSEGTLNLDGTLTSLNTAYIAGDATGDADDSTVGTLNISSTGFLDVVNGNTEAGRDGDGTLIVDGGAYTQRDGNLILGQNGGANPETSSGTVEFKNGATIIIGVDAEGGNDSNINIQGGGGTYTQSGTSTSVIVAQDFNMNDNENGSNADVSGGILNIGRDLDNRGGTGTDTFKISGDADVTVGNNLDWNQGVAVLHIVGANSSLTVNNNVQFDDSDSTVRFEFATTTGITPITANGNVTLNNAALELTGTLPSVGDFTLIDGLSADTTTSYTGTFAGLPEGATFIQSGQAFQITYTGGDGVDTVVTAIDDPLITIATPTPSVVEGDTASFTVTAFPAPSGVDLTVNFSYTGTAADSTTADDIIEVASATIFDGSTTGSFDVATILDSDLEGIENFIVNITSVTGGDSLIATPSSAQVSLFDANSAPVGNENLDQVNVGTGTVPLKDLAVNDPDATFESLVNTTVEALFHYTGVTNVTSFGDGRPDADNTFDLDSAAQGGSDLIRPDGMSVEIDFTPTAADLEGTTSVLSLGGGSNGSGIYLSEGILHLLSKANGNTANAAVDDNTTIPGIQDFDWDGNVIAVPLFDTTTVSLVPDETVRLSVIFDITNDLVTYSVNGAAQASQALVNQSGNNWAGSEVVNISGGAAGFSNVAGMPFNTITRKNLANGPGVVRSVRFWNDATGTVDTTTGILDTITATLTIADADGWAGDTDGTLTGLSNDDLGVFSVSGKVGVVNDVLAAMEFVESTATFPVTISTVIMDAAGAMTTGTIYIIDTQPDPIYVDDDFSGSFLDAVADADDGVAGAQPGQLGVSAFASIADAFGNYNSTVTIVVNDGTYNEFAQMADNTLATMELTGSGNSPGGSTVIIDSLAGAAGNSVDLDSNDIILGDNAGNNTIAGPISGTGSLTKIGTDVLILAGTSSYTGITDVNRGTLRIGNNVAAGALTGAGDIDVSLDAALQIRPGVDTTTDVVNLITGDGTVATQGNGTTIFSGGPNTFTGLFTLGDGGASTFDGVDGTKNGFTVVNTDEDLGQAGGNISSQGSQLQAGTPGIVIDSLITIDGGGLRTGGTIDFEILGDLTPTGGGNRGLGNYGLEGFDLTLSGFLDIFDTSVEIQGSEGKDNGSVIVSGDIDGTTGTFFRVGESFDGGEVFLSGFNTYEGATEVEAGSNATLFQNGTHEFGGPYSVQDTGTLSGIGTTDSTINVLEGGTITAGNSAGTIGVGDLVVRGNLDIEIFDTSLAPGVGYDAIFVTGSVDVSDATLNLIEGIAANTAMNTIEIITNDDTDAVIGIFSGLPEGGTIPKPPGMSWGDISYVGGDGNDITVDIDVMITSDDIDGDFISNFLEDAFDTDPLDPTSGREGLPMVGRAADGSTVTIRYRQLEVPGGKSYDVEESTDGAQTWSSVGAGALAGDQTGAGGASDIWEFTATVAGVPLYHLRVVVTE